MALAMRFAGSELWIATAKGANISVTGVTKANPGVFTASAAHSLAINDKVYVGAIAGMPEFLPGWYVVGTVPTGTTFTLRGVDTTSYATVGTTATAFKYTMSKACEIKTINSQNVATPEIDTTGICDTTTTFESGLKSLGTISMNGNMVAQGATQVALRGYEATGETFPIEIIFPNPTVNGRYMAPVFVQNVNFQGQVNGIWTLDASFKKAAPELFFLPT